MGQAARILRRSTALALTATAVWVCARTSGLTTPAQALQALGSDARFAVSLLQGQLPALQQEDSLPLWQRLTVYQSPLLCTAELSAVPSSVTPEPDSSGEEEAPPPPADDTDALPRTFGPVSSQSYLRAGDVYLADRAGKSPDLPALVQTPVKFAPGDGPKILIVHTHGSEAYTPSDGNFYAQTDPYRTTDCTRNMIRVGEEMAQVFRQAGLETLHDTTLYDYPSYDGAYDRSRQAVERWLSQYPSVQVVLDVHRDALTDSAGVPYKTVSGEDGAAQLMLVVGTDGSGDYHPLWQENLTFALHLQDRLLDDWDEAARPMVLRSARFNQHLSVGSVLVEVGTHGNSLTEALAGARLFARSTAAVLTEQNT